MSWGDCWYWRDINLYGRALAPSYVICSEMCFPLCTLLCLRLRENRSNNGEKWKWFLKRCIISQPPFIHFFIHFSHHLSLHHFIPILDPVFFILLPFWVLESVCRISLFQVEEEEWNYVAETKRKTAAGALARHHLPGVSCIHPPSVICRHASTSCYCVNPPQPKQVSLAFNSFLWFVTMKQKIIKLKDTIFNRCS